MTPHLHLVRPNNYSQSVSREIDTEAFATGRLACLVIENGRGGRFIFTR